MGAQDVFCCCHHPLGLLAYSPDRPGIGNLGFKSHTSVCLASARVTIFDEVIDIVLHHEVPQLLPGRTLRFKMIFLGHRCSEVL